MNHRLEELHFLPPPVGTPWVGPPPDSSKRCVRRADGKTVEIDLPLFWFDPPWHFASTGIADAIAVAVAELGVPVAALRSELAEPDGDPSLHRPLEEDDQPDEGGTPSDEQSSGETKFLPRMLPYHPERYGLNHRDFDGARVIDLRLTMTRGRTGRFGFSPERIARWEATSEDEPVAGGGWVPAATFPPDVQSLTYLSSKLQQLRVLSPSAAVFVSIGSHRLKEELPAVLACEPDGLILRFDDLALDGLSLARCTQFARRVIDQTCGEGLPLWIVPGSITPDDAVKLVALGASSVAIDDWCDDFIGRADDATQSSVSRSSYSSYRGHSAVDEFLEDELLPMVQRFKGLLNSMQCLPPDQRLTSLSGRWSRALGIPSLSLPDFSDDD